MKGAIPFLPHLNPYSQTQEAAMSPNDPKYQEMYHLLAEQLVLRPESVVANLNALIQERNINLELRILKADTVVHADPYMFTGKEV